MRDCRKDLLSLYEILSCLQADTGGPFRLSSKEFPRVLPSHRVYFFLDPNEVSLINQPGPRLVRIGTHALITGGRSTLRGRLKQHAGTTETGGGHHRGSIFRLLVGEALIARGDCEASPNWGNKSAKEKIGEHAVEMIVTRYLNDLSFLYLAVDDEPGRNSVRGRIERNSIALASMAVRTDSESISPHWLGLHSNHAKVRYSGLWNQNHVDENYESSFLIDLEKLFLASSSRYRK